MPLSLYLTHTLPLSLSHSHTQAHIYSAQYLSLFILQGHPMHPGMNNISSSSALKSCKTSLAHCLLFHFGIQDCPIHPLIRSSSHPSMLHASNLSCMSQNLKSVFICHSAARERGSLDTKMRSSIRENLGLFSSIVYCNTPPIFFF